MKASDFIEQKLRSEMIKGQMHQVLRDAGRQAGGVLMTNALTPDEARELENIAVSLSNNKELGKKTWEKAFKHGTRNPLKWDHTEKKVWDASGVMDWDDVISKDEPEEYVVVDTNWKPTKDIPAPSQHYSPKNDLVTYLTNMFNPDEYVGYSTESFYSKEAEKNLPTKGHCDRTAGQLIDELNKNDDITNVIGTWQEETGGWIRINPLDSKGFSDSNITSFRHCLVEADNQSINEQYAIIKQLQLPVTFLIHSGGKSVHALVKIDADSYETYKKRVQFIYEVCLKNGLKVDKQNRNPSRLSRLPGLTRNGNKQYIIEGSGGLKSFEEWKNYIEEVNDNLPEIECVAEHFNNLPEKSPELIHGVLRQGHKMLLSGPSKAGKSFDLQELAIAIAEGGYWHGWQCTQGKVLYINLELDSASCIHRLKDLYTALGCPITANAANIDIWNLRGKAKPMDVLAPRLIRRAKEKNYSAIIIDPIYKVLTGDENSAEQMSKFCNQFDKLCTELGVSTIVCHHHSKGSQGQKNSGDRSSGSGVFLRDPDAQIDMIEVSITEERREEISSKREIFAMNQFLYMHKIDLSSIPQDAFTKADHFFKEVVSIISKDMADVLRDVRSFERSKIDIVTGWRIEGRLREFAPFKPFHCFFNYPLHVADHSGFLNDAVAEGEYPPKKPREPKAPKEAAKTPEEKKQERLDAFTCTYHSLLIGDNPVKVSEIAESIGRHQKTVKRTVDIHPDFYRKDGEVFLKEENKVQEELIKKDTNTGVLGGT